MRCVSYRCALLCLLGAALVPRAAPQPRRRRDAADWLALISELARLGAAPAARAAPLAAPALLPPIRLEGPGGASTLQLVLVPVPAEPAQCALNAQPSAPVSVPQPPALRLPALQPSDPQSAVLRSPALQPLAFSPSTTSPQDAAPLPRVVPNDEQYTPEIIVSEHGAELGDDWGAAQAAAYRRARAAPHFPPAENTTTLLLQFLAEGAADPSLPPVLVPDGAEAPPARPEPPPTPGRTAECASVCKRKRRAQPAEVSSPPPPRFERSMTLKAVLTVPRARYSEPYELWWDAVSGASRVDYHGGAASTYRMPARGGRVQSVLLRVDRTGAEDVRRCAVLPLRRARLAERAPPALPDLADFAFAGFAGRAERWRRTVRGARGAGEALTHRHELLLARAPDNATAVPLRYAVAVDSSLLGADCDGYVHHFRDVRFVHHDPAAFQLNVGDACEQVEVTNNTRLVEPLREFTMAQRDPRYDEAFREFKSVYARKYADELEEAIRKTLFISTERFVSSGNRQGATFNMEVNFMGDRLLAEREALFGAAETQALPGEDFPYSAEKLESLRGRMPRSFSWVKKGGVTHVRNQYPCKSCWAFAVAGAVEGALFARSGRLVPLSEQSMVDCGAPYGTHGCEPTWPNFAYEYVKHRGLPALDEYPRYKGEVEQCRADSVPSVARISGHVNVTVKTVTALQVAIRRHGPVVVLVNSQPDSFMNYAGAPYADAKCAEAPSTHAMLAVGWTTVRGATVFRLKNSWSTAWGDNGYMWLRGDGNTCGVLRLPSYPVLGAADVLRVPAGAPAAA